MFYTEQMMPAVRRKLVPLALISALLTWGCSTRQELQVQTELRDSKQLKVLWAKAYPVSGGVLVQGRVGLAKGEFSHIPGHLRIEAFDTTGHMVAQTEEPWAMFPHGRHSAPFAARLAIAGAAPVARIQIEVHSAR